MTCKANSDCNDGFSCVNNVCLQKPTGQILGIEITPPSDSLSANTELPVVDLSAAQIEISADDNFAVQGLATFPTAITPIYPSQEAHVSVTIPSRFPLRGDLLISTEMAQGQFTFNVPKTRLDTGIMAKLLFLPGAAVLIQPPVNLSAPLTTMLNVTFPAPETMIKVFGRFITTTGDPLSEYLAHASYQSTKISNVVPTMSMANDGSFGLSIPPNTIPSDADDSVTLTIAPIDSQNNLVQFVSAPISLGTLVASSKVTPQVYVMPDLLPAQTFTISVTTATGEALAGVTAHFHAEVAAPSGGAAVYDISAVSQVVSQTDGGVNGVNGVVVPLIPGSATAPLMYEVSFQGPTDPTYKYASQCNHVAVSVTDAGSPVPLQGVVLTPKFSLNGTVSDSTAAPAVGATITATPTDTPSCAGVAPASGSAISDGTGYYLMQVDPGTYAIDVVPPAAATWPRLAQDPQVTVSHNTVYPISLPAGQVVQGHLTTSEVTNLPSANITIFRVFCQSIPCADPRPPIAIAITQTDKNGLFTTVLPPQP
jgi:hypothetical protein